MRFYNYFNIILVALIITGCKCGSGSELTDGQSTSPSSQVVQSDRSLSDQKSVEQGEPTDPSTDVVSAESSQEDQPALPMNREDGDSNRKKKVKIVKKKAGLPEYCKLTIQGDDTPKFSHTTLKIVRSCPKIRLTLQHIGDKPREIGGHNVVITENSRIEDLLEKAIVAGSIHHYIPRNDGRVVAATNLIGGKKSTQIEFSPKHFMPGVEYIFIDTFPDHATTMRGKIIFE